MEQKTPLYDCHIACGGKIVPFAGYLLPVQYKDSGLIKEHMAVREKAGIFDVSHMGEFLLTGKDALANLQNIFTNDFTQMECSRVRYTLMCGENGGVIDDLLVYKLEEEKYLLVVNAANREKDASWIKKHLLGSVLFSDVSDEYVQIALQGPNAKDIIAELVPLEQIPQKYYTFTENADVGGIPCILSRTGYTGSFGYELYTKSEHGILLWNLLLDTGKASGLIPCGLGARDTLRLEAAMPLYGHEMDESVTPAETGLQFAVKMEKDHFIGKSALLQKSNPLRTRVGLRVTGRGIIREHADIFSPDGSHVGISTSGTLCPYINQAVAMALIDINFSKIGTVLEAEVRGKRITAEIIPLPFLQN